MQKWQQNFRDCKQEEKEEVVMHRKQLTAVLLPWERMEGANAKRRRRKKEQ